MTTLNPLNPFSTEAIALQTRPPLKVARMVSLAICVMAALILLFAIFAHTDIVVSAQGRAIASGKS
jgi:hemolysin D